MKESKKEKIKEYLLNYFPKGNNYIKDFTTYTIKHYVEKHIGEYVSNDEVIQVFKENGYELKPQDVINPLNYYVKANYDKVKVEELNFS